MRREKIIDLGSLQVRVQELTLGQIRNLMRRQDINFSAQGFFRGEDEIPSDVLSLFTDLSPQKVEELTFSELKEVLEGVKEVNGDFFESLNILSEVTGLVEAIQQKRSNETPPS